jgi:hypothetical protein
MTKKPVLTEDVIAQATNLIRRRNELVAQLEKVRAGLKFDEPTRGTLTFPGQPHSALNVMVTHEVFDALVQPYSDQIEGLNNQLKALGVVTVDEEHST